MEHTRVYVCVFVASPSGEKDYWPGPFATARQLLENRDAVAAQRQERINAQQVRSCCCCCCCWMCHSGVEDT
jgi:hypothetical protein